MSDNSKNKIIIVSFLIIVFGFFIANIISKDKTTSKSERRNLATLGDVTFTNIVNGQVFDKFENYGLDQFVLRDSFRKLKIGVEFDVWHKKDYNDLFVYNGQIFEKEYP